MWDRFWWWRLHYHLSRAYRGWSPGKILAQESDPQMRQALCYGEAPASTARRALALCRSHFPSASTLADLGAGRGVLAMTASFHQWKVTAVEYQEEFVRRSRPVSERLGCSVEWIQADFLEQPLPLCDILHTSATAYPEEIKQRLARKLEQECRQGQGVLTQDWLLPGSRFEVLSQANLPVTWGSARFTLHRVV